MKLRYIVWFGNRSAMHAVQGWLVLASVLYTPILAQESKIDEGVKIQPDLIAGANQENPNEGTHAENAERWLRGFIQNEFNLIERVCHPSEESAQQLVDLAEKEWRNRLSNAIRAYSNSQHRKIAIGFEARIERLVSSWVQDILPEDQKNLWQKELDHRLNLRKKIVIGRMVLHADRAYGLTVSQMVEIEKILNEKWKDTWWGIYRTGTLPEAKFVWINGVLTESQRTLGTERSPAASQPESGGFIDVPSLPLHRRFTLGQVASSTEIPLTTKEAKKNSEQDANTKPQGPLILAPPQINR